MRNTVKVKIGNKDYNLSNDGSDIDIVESVAKVNKMYDFVRENILSRSASEQDVAALSALNLVEEAEIKENKYKENLDYLENELENMSNILKESLL